MMLKTNHIVKRIGSHMPGVTYVYHIIISITFVPEYDLIQCYGRHGNKQKRYKKFIHTKNFIKTHLYH